MIKHIVVAKPFNTETSPCLTSEPIMKAFIVVREPEAFQLLADETRRKILYLLRVKEMNVNQIAEELGVTSQAIYHHVKKLLKGKMIEVTKEERVGHLIESYYRATAEDFLLSTGKVKAKTVHNKELVKEQMTAVLKAYRKLGLDLEYDDDTISRLVNLWAALQEGCSSCTKPRLEDEIWNTDELSLLEKTMAGEIMSILLMSDEEFAKSEKTRREFRALLRSILKEKKEQLKSAHA
jgi:DNA-binding transcriptional ArsR family regulator